MSKKAIKSHRELEVYQLAFDAAMDIFELLPAARLRRQGRRNLQQRKDIL